MNNALCIGLFSSVLLAGCGDDGGSDDSTSAADSGTVGATTAPTTTASVDSSGGTPGTTSGTPMTSSTGEPGSTSDAMTSGTDSTGEMAESTGMVEFALTSPAFMDGQTIPGPHHVQGGNVSPELNWVGVPAEAQSLAVFFHDLSINNPHSGIWNIATSATGLPEDRESVAMPPSVPGAVQCRNWFGEYGYGGMGSPANEYEFTVYALDVPNLDGEIDSETPRAMVRQVFMDHSIAEATLTGFSGGPNAPGN